MQYIVQIEDPQYIPMLKTAGDDAEHKHNKACTKEWDGAQLHQRHRLPRGLWPKLNFCQASLRVTPQEIVSLMQRHQTEETKTMEATSRG